MNHAIRTSTVHTHTQVFFLASAVVRRVKRSVILLTSTTMVYGLLYGVVYAVCVSLETEGLSVSLCALLCLSVVSISI